MIYTKLTKKAINLAFKAHNGQYDRAGLPYILHPVHIAEQMSDEDTVVAAMLHDVVEDTDYTLDDLRAEGFTTEQIAAVDSLTHREDEDYFDYIKRVKQNRIAVKVKLADLEHNSDMTRLDNPTERDVKRVEVKYKKALEMLKNS